MLNVLTTKTKRAEGQERTFASDGYVLHLDCGDGIMEVYICPNSSNCIHLI